MLLAAELKKIWRPWSVLILVVLSILFYSAFLAKWLKPFGQEDSFDVRMGILRELIGRYGNTIDETESEEMEANYNALLARSADCIGENEIFQRYGVASYEDYLAYETSAINGVSGYDYSAYAEMREALAEHAEVSELYLQEYTEILEAYRAYGGENGSILPMEIPIYAGNYFSGLAVWCLTGVFLLAASVCAGDRASNMLSAQYSCQKGRKLYLVQYAAMLLSVLVYVSIVAGIGLAAWSRTDTAVFGASHLSSFLNPDAVSLDITYAAYIGLLTAMLYLLAIGAGSILFCLSARSANETAMLFCTLPVLVLVCLLANLLENAFCKFSAVYAVTGIIGWEPWAAGTVLLVGIGLNAWNYRKLLKRDI